MDNSHPPLLSFITVRSLALHICKANGYFKDPATTIDDEIVKFGCESLPARLILSLKKAVKKCCTEFQRWGKKHDFVVVWNPQLLKCDPFALYYDPFIWQISRVEIDDLATARFILASESEEFVKFQFAALYGIKDIVRQLDINRFYKTLWQNPVFYFWLTIKEENGNLIFNHPFRGLYPPSHNGDFDNMARSAASCAFHFAVENGFCELIDHLWNYVDEANKTRQFYRQWQTLCLDCIDSAMVRFLSRRMFDLNEDMIMHWSLFMLRHDLQTMTSLDNFIGKCEFILHNVCTPLRKKIMAHDEYRLLRDVCKFKRYDLYDVLLTFMDEEDQRKAIAPLAADDESPQRTY